MVEQLIYTEKVGGSSPSSRTDIMKILFVCRGNVGRSQFAEAIFKQLNNQHEVLSAGTKVVSKDGQSRHGQTLKELLPAGENVILALEQRGIIGSGEYARTQLSPEMVDWADIVITMAEPETAPDYLSTSPKTTYWEVKDPKGTPFDEHVRIMKEIEVLVKRFIEDRGL